MASLDDLACRVGPGDGIAARFGATALLVRPWLEVQRPVLAEIVAAAQRCASQPAAGRLLCRQLAALVGKEEPSRVPTFVALAAADRGLALFVHGEVDVAVNRSHDGEIVSGRQVATWVDRILDDPVDSVAIAPVDGELPDLDELFDLRDGVVPGGSLLLTPRSLPPTEPPEVVGTEREAAVGARPTVGGAAGHVGAAETEDEAPAPFRTISLEIGPLEEPREPLPIAGEPGAGEPGPGPSVGVLIFDDGTTFSLDGEVVVGREPDSDPMVASGQAQPLHVTDAERSVSRVHLRVVLHGEQVQLVDLRSANGTAVRPPGESAWHALAPGVATTIKPDTEVRIGDRTFLFDAHGRR